MIIGTCTGLQLKGMCPLARRFEVRTLPGPRLPYTDVLAAMLGVLVVLHAYWFCLIAAIAWRKLSTAELRDIRED